VKFHSFDIVKMVLEEADKRFAPLQVPVQERVDILHQYCDAIDKILEAGEGEEFECEVNENDGTVHLEFVVTDVIADNPRTDPLPQLIARANSFEVLPVNGETIRIRLVYPSLWENA